MTVQGQIVPVVGPWNESLLTFLSHWSTPRLSRDRTTGSGIGDGPQSEPVS